MNKAQTFVEYILVISAVTAIMIMMSTMLKRGVQGMVKTVADQVGFQNEAEQTNGVGGFVIKMDSDSRQQREMSVRDRLGNITYRYDTDITERSSVVITNGGYVED